MPRCIVPFALRRNHHWRSSTPPFRADDADAPANNCQSCCTDCDDGYTYRPCIRVKCILVLLLDVEASSSQHLQRSTNLQFLPSVPQSLLSVLANLPNLVQYRKTDPNTWSFGIAVHDCSGVSVKEYSYYAGKNAAGYLDAQAFLGDFGEISSKGTFGCGYQEPGTVTAIEFLHLLIPPDPVLVILRANPTEVVSLIHRAGDLDVMQIWPFCGGVGKVENDWYRLYVLAAAYLVLVPIYRGTDPAAFCHSSRRI